MEYKHKLTGKQMTLIKCNEYVGTFKVEPYKHEGLNKGWHDIQICKMENVEVLCP